MILLFIVDNFVPQRRYLLIKQITIVMRERLNNVKAPWFFDI